MLMIMLYACAWDIISLSLLFGRRFLGVAVNIETVTTVDVAAAFVRQIGSHLGQRRRLYCLPVVEPLAGLHR